MPEQLIVHSNLELFAVAFYRAKITALLAGAQLTAEDKAILTGFEVERVEPAEGPFPEKLLVFRDDSGPGDLFTAERAVGLSVLMDTKQDPYDAHRACAIFLGLLWQMPQGGDGTLTVGDLAARNPVASCEEVNGPYLIPEDQDRARAYGTGTLRVTPEAF